MGDEETQGEIKEEETEGTKGETEERHEWEMMGLGGKGRRYER